MARSHVLLTLVATVLLLATVAVRPTAALDYDQVKEIKQSAADAIGIIRSYELSQTYVQQISYSNQSSAISTSATSYTIGAFNLTALRAYTSTQSTRNAIKGSLREYFVNGSLYENINGKWSKIKVRDPTLAMSGFDDLKSTVLLIEASNLTAISSETLDGIDYYRLDFSPSNRYIRRTLIMEAAGAISLAGMDLPEEFLNITGQANSTMLLNSGNVSWIAWVEKESGILRRVENRESFKITPDMLGLSDGKGERFLIDANIVLTKSYGGFNEPLEILLPVDAKNATSFYQDHILKPKDRPTFL